MRKPWSTHRRNDIIQVQFYDYEKKRYLTAKSTGTKDDNKALHIIIRRWYELGLNTKVPDEVWNTVAYTAAKAPAFAPSLADADIRRQLQVIYEAVLQGDIYQKNDRAQLYIVSAQEYEDAAEEIKPLFDRLSTLTFYDYILLYWNYEESPYIKGLIRKGTDLPNLERFYHHTTCIKKYAPHFPACLLTEITGEKIDTMLGSIKRTGNLKEKTMHKYRYICIQALRFAYKNNLLARDISQQITRESKSTRKKAKKEAEKAIFTQEEIQRLFNGKDNPFGSQTNWLINEMLFKTGCRIGELQALQMQDFIKNADGYALKVDKNYCRTGKRLKSTKTERSDIVPISADLAAKLIAHIEKNPFKDIPTAFLFNSPRSAYKPFCYESFNKDFHRTMVTLGIKRTNLTLHSYRHTYATFLRMAGYSEEQLRCLTRHDSVAEVQLYTDHHTPDMERLKLQAVSDIEKITV